MRISTFLAGLGATLSAGLVAGVAAAQDALPVIGQPVDGAMGFQPAVTEVARDLQWLDGMMTYIMGGIVLLVTVLILYAAFRFRASRNPTPAQFSHNSPLEIAWTLGPVMILVFIGAFSLPVLFKELEIPKADVTIKVSGQQWYWTYDYLDDGFSFDSMMLDKADLKAAGYDKSDYLLAADNAMVVPVNKVIVVKVTGLDVIHSWTVPAFGVKQDAVPGRLADLWFKADKEGIYFGQCSELCGLNHAYMPITVKVVSEKAYEAWLAKAKKEYAALPSPVTVASND